MKKGVIITGSIITVVIIGLVCFGESFRPGVTVKNITRFGNVITTTFKSTVMQGSFLIKLCMKKLLLTERNMN